MSKASTQNKLDQLLPSVQEWKKIVSPHTKPSAVKATWQVINSLGSYIALWIAMYFTLSISYWLTFAIALFAGAILVRVFIIFHDCGHGSFYKSRRAGNIIGFISGVFTFTPFSHWKWEHSVHHSASGDLDRRGTGDVWTMTVDEYLGSSRRIRFIYRAMRNPFILFMIAPLYLFLIRERFSTPGASPHCRKSVWKMNLAIGLLALALILIYGWLPYLLIQLTTICVAAISGVWLFYVQHQFEGVYWEREDDWDFTSAALAGSSFYKLPKVLQWFSGNIGYHHIHHLSSRIPNYNLEACHNSHKIFQSIEPLTFLSGFKSLGFRLWDEKERELVSFKRIKGSVRSTSTAS
ncbi:MAG: fatty acid desaturase [Akkermansiaceae bacterium]|nr:fatty acid desaturase [Akkermansiaceae bacterium]|tara:strand:- start:35 stop:1084 length:1050 start_codon:yes stop_codon:yes gene_type:complete